MLGDTIQLSFFPEAAGEQVKHLLSCLQTYDFQARCRKDDFIVPLRPIVRAEVPAVDVN